MYKFYYLIGLELNVLILLVVLWGEFIGQFYGFCGDVVLVVKCDLCVGEMLDGEGGYMVWGKLVLVVVSFKVSVLLIGFVYWFKLKYDVVYGEIVCWSDVVFDLNDEMI